MAIYSKPEEIYGYKHVTKAYKESPEESRERIISQIKKCYNVDEALIRKIIK